MSVAPDGREVERIPLLPAYIFVGKAFEGRREGVQGRCRREVASNGVNCTVPFMVEKGTRSELSETRGNAGYRGRALINGGAKK